MGNIPKGLIIENEIKVMYVQRYWIIDIIFIKY